MSQDWMLDTAKAIHDECPIAVDKAVRKYNGEDIADAEIMVPIERITEILRSHAPPVPQWCERPTRDAWWTWARFAFDGEVIESGFCRAGRTFVNGPDIRWYGPIPSQGAAK